MDPAAARSNTVYTAMTRGKLENHAYLDADRKARQPDTSELPADQKPDDVAQYLRNAATSMEKEMALKTMGIVSAPAGAPQAVQTTGAPPRPAPTSIPRPAVAAAGVFGPQTGPDVTTEQSPGPSTPPSGPQRPVQWKGEVRVDAARNPRWARYEELRAKRDAGEALTPRELRELQAFAPRSEKPASARQERSQSHQQNRDQGPERAP